jgi:hypothetical protein
MASKPLGIIAIGGLHKFYEVSTTGEGGQHPIHSRTAGDRNMIRGRTHLFGGSFPFNIWGGALQHVPSVLGTKIRATQTMAMYRQHEEIRSESGVCARPGSSPPTR